MRFSSPHDLTDTRACRPIIPISAATDPDHARPLALRGCPGLLERLAMIPDPRDRWAGGTPWPGCWPSAPRRDLLTHRCQVPGEAHHPPGAGAGRQRRCGCHRRRMAGRRLHPPSHRRVLAVDGKRLRGSARAGHQVHLLAALDHHDGAVLAQRDVPADQPVLHDQLAGLPWLQIPVMDRTREHAGQPLAHRHRVRSHQPDPRHRPAPRSWPAGFAGTGRSRTGCTGSAT